MSRSSTNSLPANLELDGGIVLGGTLRLSAAEALQLDSAKLLHAPPELDRIKVRTGDQGLLRNEFDISLLPVEVTGVKGHCINLVIRDPEGAAAAEWQALLLGTPRSQMSDEREDASRGTGLGDLETVSLQELESLINRFMDKLMNHLFELSTGSSQISSGQDAYFEALNAVRRRQQDITGEFLEAIRGHFSDLTPREGTDSSAPIPASADSLDLVDLRDFEDHLAIARMVRIGEELHRVALESLIFRTATLIDADPLEVRLPVHVAQLCAAFRRAIDGKGIPTDTLPSIFDLFVGQFIRGLGHYYGALNESLSSRGVCPGIEEEIRTRGSLLHKGGRGRPTEERHEPDRLSAASEHSESPPAAGGTAAGRFRSALKALNTVREAGRPEYTQATGHPSAPAFDPGAVAATLEQLQHDQGLREKLGAGSSLLEHLSANQFQGAELSPESLNQLDLVDALFHALNRRLDEQAALVSRLGELQIPLARLALLEPEFFGTPEHPARAVVDRVAELGRVAQWPNRSLESRIEKIVQQVVDNYQQDSSVFDTALKQIDKLTRQQERAAQRNRERVVSAEEGQARLERARREVEAELNNLLRSPTSPRVLQDLLEQGLREFLILIHVKEGSESGTWNDSLLALAMLNKLLQRATDPAQAGEALLAEAEPLLNEIGARIADVLPTSVDHEPVLEELRSIIGGELELATMPVSEESDRPSSDLRERIETLPHLRRWVRRADRLEPGDWLSYRDGAGRTSRMQLAWIHPDRNRYVFVNEQGQKHADLGLVDLARQLSHGAKSPPPSEDRMSTVDRGLLDTLEQARETISFARNHDALTQLVNQETLLDQMRRALRHAQRRSSEHGVLYLDIDRFGLVNEVYGRENGDQMLAEFGRLLAQMHDNKVSSARVSEDEFAILLLDRPLDEALAIAEKIRADIEHDSAEIEGESVGFTVSIGVAPLVEHSDSVESVMALAREAMLEAKQAGGNRSACSGALSDTDAAAYQQAKVRSRQELEQALDAARYLVQARTMRLASLTTGDAGKVCYELWSGLRNEDGLETTPEQFMDDSLRYGLAGTTDRWLVRNSCAWIQGLMDEQKVVPEITIRLAGSSVSEDAFLDYVLEQISTFGVGTSQLCFEIHETSAIASEIKAADFIQTLRNIGCRFTLGGMTGDSGNQAWARELPVNFIKLGAGLTSAIHNDRTDFALVQSINDLAHFLGQQTIAETLESEQTIAALREIGVDYLQGCAVEEVRPLTEITGELGQLEH